MREFRVGQRVRCYQELTPFTGTVIDLPESDADKSQVGTIWLSSDGEAQEVWPQACRLLRPKKKLEEAKRVERWVNVYDDDRDKKFYSSANKSLEEAKKNAAKDLLYTVHLVELKDSEIIVDRAALARAWDARKIMPDRQVHAATFNLFCTALGLKANEEGGV